MTNATLIFVFHTFMASYFLVWTVNDQIMDAKRHFPWWGQFLCSLIRAGVLTMSVCYAAAAWQVGKVVFA